MAGKTFQFSISGGPTISVKGGRCSGPMQVTAGSVTITELDAGTDVAAVQVRPSSRLLSSNLSARQVVVNVPAGSSAANETRVTYVNQPAGGTKGDLKICKLSETPAFWGRQFSFTVNGGPAFSTEANPAFDDPSAWSCRLAGSFPVGSRVTVQELIPAGAEIAYIDTDPGDRLLDLDTNAGTALVEIGSGMTVVLYDNEAPAPEGTGWIEVCKDRAKLGHYDYDWDVQGLFEFLVTDAAGSEYELSVYAGQCSEPLQIAAGIARVEELARQGFDLVDVYTIPEDRLLDANLINRTADVEIPVSDNPNDETQVHFVNKAQRAQLKLCKALGPGSSDLIGRRFEFSVGDPSKLDPYRHSIIAAASTQCVIIGDYTIGTEVTINELLDREAEHIAVSGEGTYVIKPGINTVTITNRALGKLEICKFILNPSESDNREFTFKVDGSLTVKVRPGRCSPPLLVTPGNHTVTELADGTYELDPNAPGNGISVTPSDRELSKNLLGRSVTVYVPWASHPYNGGETRVDFYNRARRGQVKVCKQITPGSVDALANKSFDFVVTIDGRTFTLTGIKPGECRIVVDQLGLPVNAPIIYNGQPMPVTVNEVGASDAAVPGPGEFYVSNLALQGAGVPGKIDCTYAAYSPTGLHCRRVGGMFHISWGLGPNTNTVHFTNTAGDP